MAQWEEKLNTILNDPQAMRQIMSIAQSLGGAAEEPDAPQAAPAEPEPTAAVPELDPRVMEVGMQALAAWQAPDDARAALLRALRPFLRQERQVKVDKAVRIAKLSKVIRVALDGLGGGDRSGV